jgi:hypothetical protein
MLIFFDMVIWFTQSRAHKKERGSDGPIIMKSSGEAHRILQNKNQQRSLKDNQLVNQMRDE